MSSSPITPILINGVSYLKSYGFLDDSSHPLGLWQWAQFINKYDLVHFDGPHKTVDVIKEVIFFGERSHAGTVFVFDDYPKFNMDLILKVIVNEFGFMLLKQGKNKISLKRN